MAGIGLFEEGDNGLSNGWSYDGYSQVSIMKIKK